MSRSPSSSSSSSPSPSPGSSSSSFFSSLATVSGLSGALGNDTAELLIAVTFTVAVCAILAAVIRLVRGSRASGDTVLLLGSMGAGKTTLFYQLKDGETVETTTSMSENEARFIPHQVSDTSKTRPLQFVDFPGHGSQLYRLQKHIPNTRAIILVVDASDAASLAPLSLVLYREVLSSPSLSSRHVPLMIACNKSDVDKALSVEEIQNKLQQLIEKQRRFGTSEGMTDIQGGTEKKAIVGKAGQPFTFVDSSLPTSFCAISSSGTSPQIAPLLSWINKL